MPGTQMQQITRNTSTPLHATPNRTLRLTEEHEANDVVHGVQDKTPPPEGHGDHSIPRHGQGHEHEERKREGREHDEHGREPRATHPEVPHKPREAEALEEEALEGVAVVVHDRDAHFKDLNAHGVEFSGQQHRAAAGHGDVSRSRQLRRGAVDVEDEGR